MVAEALGSCDLARARRLLAPLTNRGDVERYTANLAVAVGDVSLAPTDRVKMRIAYGLAAKQPDEAVRLVESIEETKLKVEAFGWVAVALAPRDKTRAWALIDRAFDICLNDTQSFRSWSNYGGGSVFAARLASQAAEIGYPDRESLVFRTLALRQTTRYESPVRVDESRVATAMILALFDPATAREMLQAVEPRAHTIGTGSGSVGRRQWLQAWALADPRHAEEVVARGLADWKSRPADRVPEGLIETLEMLTAEPDRRAYHLLHYFGGFWFPGEE
jgi:hypothetical protein